MPYTTYYGTPSNSFAGISRPTTVPVASGSLAIYTSDTNMADYAASQVPFWDAATAYSTVGQQVLYDNQIWAVVAGSTGVTPGTDPTKWGLLGTSSIYALKGANSDITSLSGLTGGIATPTNIDFDTVAAAPSYLAGRLFYDTANPGLSVYTDVSGAAQHLGGELWLKVRNQSGAAIDIGKVVYISGATGQLPKIDLAKADSESTCAMIGVVASGTIADNGMGYVCMLGMIGDLNTHTFTDGQAVYLSATTAGELTATPPVAPNCQVLVGYIAHAHITQGKLVVRSLPRFVNFNSIINTPTTLAGYGITDALSNALASAKILVGDGGGLAAAVSVSGDATLSNTGVLTLASNLALGGSPTTTTQAEGDNSTKISTTAYAYRTVNRQRRGADITGSVGLTTSDLGYTRKIASGTGTVSFTVSTLTAGVAAGDVATITILNVTATDFTLTVTGTPKYINGAVAGSIKANTSVVIVVDSADVIISGSAI